MSFSAVQDTLRLLCNPKVYYRVHDCSPLDPILRQINPVNIRTLYFLQIHFNIILSSTPCLPSDFFTAASLFAYLLHKNKTENTEAAKTHSLRAVAVHRMADHKRNEQW
jgi:hypothetical protein